MNVYEKLNASASGSNTKPLLQHDFPEEFLLREHRKHLP